ncbi:hypothetical protein [Vulcanococcus limneticus]|uniref:hypothetical protein n=1 Tax=Vulcanococcus limneticus TaxID=2170428 RepID=UPI00398BC1F3
MEKASPPWLCRRRAVPPVRLPTGPCQRLMPPPDVATDRLRLLTSPPDLTLDLAD